MSFLIRYIAKDVSGEIVHDETVVAPLASIDAIEKTVFVLGCPLTLRIEFDPALSPSFTEVSP